MEDTRATDAQPQPVTTNDVDITELVIEDLNQRRELGIKRYGTTLRPFNGRDSMIDLYQELLDAVQYIRQLIYEANSHNRI